MRAAVVGSGPAGAAAALALVEAGHAVDLIDFGNEPEPESLALGERLRSRTATPADYERLRPARATFSLSESLREWANAARARRPALDLMGKKHLGSDFPHRDVDRLFPVSGGPAARSLALGGLSNVWGAACYPLADGDDGRWPLRREDLAPHYEAVAREISLGRSDDGLTEAFDVPGAGASVELTEAARDLLSHWQRNRRALAEGGFRFGRTRLAVRAEDSARGAGCKRCGLCHYGCPHDAIYRSTWTIEDLRLAPGFRYVGGVLVTRFEETGDGVYVIGAGGREGRAFQERYDRLFLAAGTLGSLAIACRSLAMDGREVPILDNDHFLVLFMRLRAGAPPPPDFALSELALRFHVAGFPLHVQLYAVSDAVIDQFRPLIGTLPRPLARRLERLMNRFFLGFLYLPSRASAKITATVERSDPFASIRIRAERGEWSRFVVGSALAAIRRHFRALGLLQLGGAVPGGPWGSSGGHLAGSLPMAACPGPLQTDPGGVLFGTKRVHVVDGSVLPDLPAQNSTLTIMANARRVALIALVQGAVSFPGDATARLGADGIHPGTIEVDHHDLQYESSRLAAAYHRRVLRLAVRAAHLRSGMHVLDYGCGEQQLRRFLPAGVRYTGYDAQPRLSDVSDPRLSDVSDPRGRRYDVVFALQVLFYVDRCGLSEIAAVFADLSDALVVMLPSRNWIKDEVLDRLFGLAGNREELARSRPAEVYEALSARFERRWWRSVWRLGEITRWARRLTT